VDGFERDLTVAWHSYRRWAEAGMAVAGLPGLGATEATLLLALPDEPPGVPAEALGAVADGVVQAHAVRALGRLQSLGAVVVGRRGAEPIYRLSAQGRVVVRRFAEIRRACLLQRLAAGRRALLQLMDGHESAARIAGEVAQIDMASVGGLGDAWMNASNADGCKGLA
jgi:predicted MarR family transcription regulator